MDREHLVEPERLTERGIASWVGLILLFAGVIVTAGGVYEWNKRKIGDRPDVVASPAPSTAYEPYAAARKLEPVDPETAELRRQLAEERRTD